MRRVLTLALAAAANALALETRSIGGWSALLEMPTTRRRAKRERVGPYVWARVVSVYNRIARRCEGVWNL